MKKILLILCLLFSFFIFVLNVEAKNLVGLPNPWVDCGVDLKCAMNVSGIKFQPTLSNYNARAMKGMIEIAYPLDEFRNVTVRKCAKSDVDDISGVYVKYPKNKKIKLKNKAKLKIRGEKDKIYVMNLKTKNAIYSAYCNKGMTIDEVEGIYNLIKETDSEE